MERDKVYLTNLKPRLSMNSDNQTVGDEQSTTSGASNVSASLTPTEISFLNNLMKIPSGKKRLLKGLLTKKQKSPADNPLLPKNNSNNKNKSLQQFKQDEEVVMNAMNRKLEQEQRTLERRRAKEEKRNREIIQKQMKEMSTNSHNEDDDTTDDGMPSFAAKYARASGQRKSQILRKECGCLRYPQCLCQSLSQLVDAPLDTTSSTASSSIMDASHNDMSIASVSLSGISLGTGMTSANMSAMFDNEVDSVDLNRVKLEAPTSTVTTVKRKKSKKKRSSLSSRLDASPTSVVVGGSSDNASIMSGMDSSAMSITAL